MSKILLMMLLCDLLVIIKLKTCCLQHPLITISFCSVAYVSRSGGMSNELNNIISHNTDGVYEGVAIGGDRYPGTTFMDHLLRYHDNPEV